jgi:7,8-dihydropterin-6-yl-methyl-4-(beta-D-ribofuranosyl)aminobenzene 5'-phosphate synthase
MPSEAVKITILVDNQACTQQSGGELGSEHGLSLWIEAGGMRILLDTGQGGVIERNVAALGVDLGTTDILVLSHGHYDHTGGLPYVLRYAEHAAVYCHPAVRLPRYAVKDGESRPIGIPARPLMALEGLPPERLHWVKGPVNITDGVGITGPIPRDTDYEDTGGPFYLDPAGRSPDLLEDDLALWIETEEGTVVCLGCAHSGVVNTLDRVRGLTGGAPIRAIIGGLHLVNADPTRVEKTIAALRALHVPTVAPCHCTGADALRMLGAALGDTVTPGAAGMTFRF